ncbi:hypothetical protein DYBT9275_01627 [Dyadobacter sp. CECT 9275]|uniref:Gliding motility-associated C-terminal domain-containing protein n=1 Tax=Dyadobacter helix TaxID=2822344 RepID=A0A916JAP0_9BACT|nr:gliding motility-associated C-terminal domain-containing protein [Dyadobacter sp. CECT 9275]CAG4995396.1 hypothetical protein DYBT9275_01627 [Dyadobacter sp. CECT 9275]
MKQLLLTLCFLVTVFSTLKAQVDCSNVGFEQGNTSGWQPTYGAVTDQDQKTVYQTEITGTQNNDHYVTSLSDGNDPKIPSIPMVAPGSTHSIRIGNVTQGGQYSRIRTSYLVTADNTLFQYKFAVILQNTSGNGGAANHEPYQKPGFNIQIYDNNGNELPCSSYDIQLEGNNTVDGFQSSGDIQYRNWTTGAIDLRNYVGKSISIAVTTHGCTRMRHFGYAYFDAECLKSEIKTVSSCPDENGYLTLQAPVGFGKYKWNNGETTQNIKVKASLGDKFSVQLVPLGSLDESCALQLDYTIELKKSVAEISKVICEGEEVALGDTILKTSGTYVRNISKSTVCDSTVTLHLTVNSVPRFTQTIGICEGEELAVGDSVYTTSGTYVNNIPLPTGCDSIVTTHLEVYGLNLSVTPQVSITEGDSVQLHAIAEPTGEYKYNWQMSQTLSCSTCADTWAHPSASTTYTVIASDPGSICIKQGKVSVMVKPCGISAPEIFSPNQDNSNEIFYVFGNSCVVQIKEMVIYNRWGQVIFHKQNFQASNPSFGWDGYYKGLPSLAGAYPYKVKAELKNGGIQDYNGVVTLIR